MPGRTERKEVLSFYVRDEEKLITVKKYIIITNPTCDLSTLYLRSLDGWLHSRDGKFENPWLTKVENSAKFGEAKQNSRARIRCTLALPLSFVSKIDAPKFGGPSPVPRRCRRSTFGSLVNP